MSSVPPSSDEISRGLKVKPFEGGTEGMADSSLNEAPKLDVHLVAGWLRGFSERSPDIRGGDLDEVDRRMLRAGSDWIMYLLREGQPARRAE